MKKLLTRTAILLLLLLAVATGLYKWMNASTYQAFGELVHSVDTEEKVVALTFDDGPTPEHTEDVLALLGEADVKATFFVIGSDLEENMEAGEKLVQAGHELGNHTYSHQRMIFKTPSFIETEIEKTDALIRQVGYEGDIHFRPPNGKKLLLLPWYLDQHDRTTITWDLAPEDFPEHTADPQVMTERVLEGVKPGSIILFHVMYDSREASREALRATIDGLKEQGYRFVTVSELLAQRVGND